MQKTSFQINFKVIIIICLKSVLIILYFEQLGSPLICFLWNILILVIILLLLQIPKSKVEI